MAPKRRGVTFCIHIKTPTDVRVLCGNKIISRHTTKADAQTALDAIFCHSRGLSRPRRHRKGSCAMTDPPSAASLSERSWAAQEELLAALQEAARQIEYLHDKFQETGSGNAVLARARAAIARAMGEM